jgi:CHAD domain-containing protein
LLPPTLPADQIHQIKATGSIKVGEFARRALALHLNHLTRRERAVRKGRDPEALHQMRVAARRLRSVQCMFSGAIQLPAPCRERRVRDLGRTLGCQRDLEVRLQDLRRHYRPMLRGSALHLVDRLIEATEVERHDARRAILRMLESKKYQHLRSAFEDWLRAPVLTPAASLSLELSIPDLMTAALAQLLLHPGWAQDPGAPSEEAGLVLHDLRKAVKRTRYQAEVLQPYYGPELQVWAEELHSLQDALGVLQDARMLRRAVRECGEAAPGMRGLIAAVHQREVGGVIALRRRWERYLDPGGRQALRVMVLRVGGGNG